MAGPSRMKRAWFPLSAVLVAALGTVGIWQWPGESPEPGVRFFVSFSLIGLALILCFVWLLAFSGLRWTVRLGAFVAVIGALAGAGWALEPEIDFAGDMYPRFYLGRSRKMREALAAHRAASPRSEAPSRPLSLQPGDFPEYRNVARDGVVSGPPLNPDWEAAKPHELWRQPCGGGYAGFVVAGDLAVTIEQRGDVEATVAYDAATGRERWTYAVPAYFREPLGGNGPRATPTIAGDAVYSLGATGQLVALDAASGRLRWKVDILADNSNIQWGMCGAPLAVDDLVIVTPGCQQPSANGRAVMALDRATGQVRWAGGDRKTAYASPQLATLGGLRQLLVLDAGGLAGFEIATGRQLWFQPWATYQDINVAQPLVVDGERVFISSGYGHGCAMLKVTRNDGEWKVEPLWANNRMKCKFSSPVLHRGFIFGLDEAHLVCMDSTNGKVRWKGQRYGYGQILRAGDYVVVGAETGALALVEARPEEFREVAAIKALSGDKNWNHLALANGRVYVRNHFEMACFELPTR